MNPKRTLLVLAIVFTLMGCGWFTVLQGEPTPAKMVEAVAIPSETPSAVPPTLAPTETPPPPTELPPTAKPEALTLVEEPPAPVLAPMSEGEELEIGWIQMVDPTRGWAIGGVPGGPGSQVLVTGDGGVSFRDVSPPVELPGTPDTVLEAFGYFWDADRGWVLYTYTGMENPLPIDPQIWYTTDGGENWGFGGSLPLTGMEGYFFQPILVFSDPDHGWLLAHVDAGMSHDYIELFKTVDGGASWAWVMDPMTLDSPQACHKTGMDFATPDYGWLTKDCGGVIDGVSLDISDDGGATWWNLPLTPPDSDPAFFSTHVCGAYDPVLFSEGQGALVVHCNWMDDWDVVVDLLYTTEDDGLHWETQSYPGGGLLFLNPDEAWAFGGEVYWTADGGGTWEQIGKVTWDGQFSFVDVNYGWAVARAVDEAGEEQIALVQTTNGARRWGMLEPVLTEE